MIFIQLRKRTIKMDTSKPGSYDHKHRAENIMIRNRIVEITPISLCITAFCDDFGIYISGKRLGRYRKNTDKKADKITAYKDNLVI